MAEPPDTTIRNPYPGLRPFRTDEKHLFFGREAQVDRMVGKLAAHHFLAVVGGSGSGKSSLVNCGLRPALHRGNMASAGAAWRMAQMRPGSDPIGALASALAAPGVLFGKLLTGAVSSEALVESTLRLGSLGLIDIVDQADLPAGTQVLVVADQFEELFRFRALVRGAHQDSFSPAEDAVAFVLLLLEAAAQSALPIYVVLTMRSDFLGDCAQFHGLPEAINEGEYLVPRLTRNEIRAAITGPAAVAGATLSPVLVTRLLNDVGDNPDQLSILQHALNRTWARWETDGQASGPLELVHYEAAGGMARALDTHAEKAFNELRDAPSQRLCEQIFKALTDTGTDPRGIRRPTTLAALGEITGASPEQRVAVINVFRKPSRSFLMPPLPMELGPDSPIDVSHESLMRVWRRLKTWADEEAQSARIYRRLRETALEYDKQQANPLRDPELRLVLDWREMNTPTAAWGQRYGGGFDSAMAFLDRSRDEQNQEKLEAEIEARWQSTWRWAPIVLTGAAFIGLQLGLAAMLERGFQEHSGKTWIAIAEWIKRFRLDKVLPHVLAGMPAAVGYVFLAPYVRKCFPTWEKYWQAWAPVIQGKPAAPADAQALGYASFRQRALAQLVDWVLCLVPTALLIYVLRDDHETGLVLFGVGATVIFYLYHVAFWRSKRQGTLGMRLAGVFVTDRQGRRLGLIRATSRFFARWLSYYTAGLGFLMQPFNKECRALHDHLSGTVVLRRKPAQPFEVHELSYASFGRRAVAQSIDWALCLLASLTIGLPIALVAGWEGELGNLFCCTFFLIAFSYHVICWTSSRQATFGMMLAGTCVTDKQRHRLTKKRAAGRFFLRWLSYGTAGLGFLMQPFTKERQALHDRLGATLVLRGEPNAGARS